MGKDITKQGDEAHELHKNIVALKNQMGMAFVMMGKFLKDVRDKEYFKVLGYDNFISYVVNSELGFEKRTAYYYIEICEWFVEKFGYDEKRLAEIGYYRLVRLLPIVKKAHKALPESKIRGRVDILVDEIQVLRPIDFKKKYKDEKANDGHDDYLAPPEYFRCECHKKWRLTVPLEDCCPVFLGELKSSLDDFLVDKQTTK